MNAYQLTFDHVTKSLAASPRLRITGCSMTSSGISRLYASRKVMKKVKWLVKCTKKRKRRTFNQCPARLAARSVASESDVRFEVGYYACCAVQSLLGHALEEEIERLNKPLLRSRRRGTDEPLIVTSGRIHQLRWAMRRGRSKHTRGSSSLLLRTSSRCAGGRGS